MNLLLDTHTLIWMALAEENLGDKARQAIEDPNNQLFFSAATLWEMSIKEAKKKLSVPKGVAEFFKKSQSKYEISLMAIEPQHLKLLKSLPNIHSDPFDRLLICQARSEEMTIVTKDSYIHSYKVKSIWR